MARSKTAEKIIQAAIELVKEKDIQQRQRKKLQCVLVLMK